MVDISDYTSAWSNPTFLRNMQAYGAKIPYQQPLIASDPMSLNPAYAGPTTGLPSNVNQIAGGGGGAPGTNYSPYVTNLYQDILGRAPDPSGLQNWTTALSSGRLSQQQVANEIAASPEATTRSQSLAPAPTGTGSSTTGTVTPTTGTPFTAPKLNLEPFSYTPSDNTGSSTGLDFSSLFSDIKTGLSNLGGESTSSGSKRDPALELALGTTTDPTRKADMTRAAGIADEWNQSHPTTSTTAPAAAPAAAPQTSGLPYGYQGLNQQPISAGLLEQLVNYKNAQTLGGAAETSNQMRESAASSGYGAYNPALKGAQQSNLSNAYGQVAQTGLQLPFEAAQFNAKYGLNAGDLTEQQRSNLANEQLGVTGTQTDRYNALLKMLGGL